MFTMHFPNSEDGTMDITEEELAWLIDNGHAKIRADKIRRVTIPILGDFHRQSTDVRVMAPGPEGD